MQPARFQRAAWQQRWRYVALRFVILTRAPALLMKLVDRSAPFFGLLAPAVFSCLRLAGLLAERLKAGIVVVFPLLKVVVLPLVAH